jgi:hypothetical protein
MQVEAIPIAEIRKLYDSLDCFHDVDYDSYVMVENAQPSSTDSTPGKKSASAYELASNLFRNEKFPLDNQAALVALKGFVDVCNKNYFTIENTLKLLTSENFPLDNREALVALTNFVEHWQASIYVGYVNAETLLQHPRFPINDTARIKGLVKALSDIIASCAKMSGAHSLQEVTAMLKSPDFTLDKIEEAISKIKDRLAAEKTAEPKSEGKLTLAGLFSATAIQPAVAADPTAKLQAGAPASTT